MTRFREPRPRSEVFRHRTPLRVANVRQQHRTVLAPRRAAARSLIDGPGCSKTQDLEFAHDFAGEVG